MPPYTLATALRHGTDYLSATSSSARLDAQILLAAAIGRPRSHLIAYPEETLDPAAAARFEQWLQRRAAGVPVAYLTGRKEFWSLELEVTTDVLDPRPETELLVESVLQWLPPDRPVNVLDLGTGSGAIALAIARERPRAQVVATDLSAAALEVARRNAARLNLANVTFLCGEWYRPLGNLSFEPRFDAIVSNPPYIAAGDHALETPELRAEPRTALTPGPSGLEALEHIARHARQYLRMPGLLAVEHGMDQGAAINLLFSLQGLQAVQTLQDLAGRDRVTRGESV